MTRSRAIATLLPLILMGCNLFQQEVERSVVAEAAGQKLYWDDLQQAMPSGLSSEDSTLFADNHIRQWATRQLMLERAELNLSNEQKDVSRKLEEYRRSLLVYLYQTEWVRQQMDTVVSDEEIAMYHESNSRDLELQEDIVRAMLIVLPLKDPEADNIRKWMRKDDDPELRSVLETYCLQHAITMHLNDNDWVPLENVIAQLPKDAGITAAQARYRNSFDVNDSTARYMLDIKELRQKGTTAPVEYVSENIASIILNRRKLEMMRKLERNIYEQAANKGKVIIHN
jgi:hypothetical protein